MISKGASLSAGENVAHLDVDIAHGCAQERRPEEDDDDPLATAPPISVVQPARQGRVVTCDSDDDSEPLVVVTDYHKAAHHRGSMPLQVLDTATGQQLDADNVREHMRIKTLDPRWKQQQEREREKLSSTNMAPDADMSRVLFSFAEHRPDMFGDVEGRVGQKVSETSQSCRSRVPGLSGTAASRPSTTVLSATTPAPVHQTGLAPNTQARTPTHLGSTASSASSLAPALFAGGPDPHNHPGAPAHLLSAATGLHSMPAAPAPAFWAFGGYSVPSFQPCAAAQRLNTPAEPAPKRQKVESKVASASTLPQGDMAVSVAVPDIPGNAFGLHAQSITVRIPTSARIQDVKQQLQTIFGIPVTKFQLRNAAIGSFLKDLEHVPSGTTLEFVLRERGGKKK